MILCSLAGQPRNAGETPLLLDDIESNPELWVLPAWATHARLAFKWEITEGGNAQPRKCGFCVISLKKAEQRGVPLPTGWAPEVAALIDIDALNHGVMASHSCQPSPVDQSAVRPEALSQENKLCAANAKTQEKPNHVAHQVSAAIGDDQQDEGLLASKPRGQSAF